MNDVPISLRLPYELRLDDRLRLHDEMVVLVDGHHRVIHISDRMHELTRLRPGDLVGLDHVVLLDPDEGETFDAAFGRARAAPGSSEQVSVRLVDGPGLRRTFELTIANRLDDVAVGAMVVTAVDVSQRRARQVVEHLRYRLLDVLPAVVTVVDDVGTIVYCSPWSEVLLGRTPSEIVGRPISGANLLPVEPEHVEQIRLAAETTGHWEGDVDLRREDGEIVPVHLILERIDDEQLGFSGTIGISFDVAERRKLEAHLEFQAAHDALTGLFNRQQFVRLLERALVTAHDAGRRVAVVFIDLDDFKVVNDRIGHAAGDRLLVAVGDRLRSALPPDCVAARFGGDEFVVFSPDIADETSAIVFTQHLIDALAPPAGSDDGGAAVSASAGVALSRPSVEAEELLRRSDQAMYGAKDAGKRRIEVFDDDVSNRKRRRRELADGLERALDRGEITVHFQPEVTLGDGRVSFFEALVRWDDPQRGAVPPAEFIGIAEASGLIHRIGKMVFESSCRAMRSWLDLGLADGLSVAINVSARQLLDHGFPDLVESLLSEWGVPAHRVCLEVTESTLVDADVGSQVLQRLDAIGVAIAVDDFGTGYSSLGRLTEFPLDFLKIDRAFVAGLADDPTSGSIVRMIITLAHELGVQVTAEGVETEEQLARLLVLGCDIGQGHLWSPALPFDEATALLARQPFVGTLPHPRRRIVRNGPSDPSLHPRSDRQNIVRVERTR